VLVVMGLVLAGAVIAALALARREDVEQKDERAS
jgi:predicted outer membrane lipoprotein